MTETSKQKYTSLFNEIKIRTERNQKIVPYRMQSDYRISRVAFTILKRLDFVDRDNNWICTYSMEEALTVFGAAMHKYQVDHKPKLVARQSKRKDMGTILLNLQKGIAATYAYAFEKSNRMHGLFKILKDLKYLSTKGSKLEWTGRGVDTNLIHQVTERLQKPVEETPQAKDSILEALQENNRLLRELLDLQRRVWG